MVSARGHRVIDSLTLSWRRAAAELGRIGRGLYGVLQAAGQQLARSLAAELTHRGVRVNAVVPGPILTSRNVVPTRRAEKPAAFVGKMVPIGRVGMSEM